MTESSKKGNGSFVLRLNDLLFAQWVLGGVQGLGVELWIGVSLGLGIGSGVDLGLGLW